jgi:uncharacterized membrane protein YhaH (DUF805 family)
MTVFELLYGFQGRISRAQWWLGQLILLAMLGLFYVFWSGWLATNDLTEELIKSAEPGMRFKILAFLLVLSALLSSVLVWMAFSLAIKRVHDLGRSGWRTLAYSLPLFFVELMPSTAFTSVALIIAVWYVLELGCFRGYPRHNQYGPATTPDDVISETLDVSNEPGVVEGADRALADVSERNAATANAKFAARGTLASATTPSPGPELRQPRFGRRIPGAA